MCCVCEPDELRVIISAKTNQLNSRSDRAHELINLVIIVVLVTVIVVNLISRICVPLHYKLLY